MRARLLGFGLAALAVLFLAVKLVSPSRGGKIARGFVDAPFGAFAGYAWEGTAKSVGASFTVPRIASGSPLSQAGTWMSVNGGNLAPTAVHEDSFTLQRAPALIAAAEQYVRLAAPALDAMRSARRSKPLGTLH